MKVTFLEKDVNFVANAEIDRLEPFFLQLQSFQKSHSAETSERIRLSHKKALVARLLQTGARDTNVCTIYILTTVVLQIYNIVNSWYTVTYTVRPNSEHSSDTVHIRTQTRRCLIGSHIRPILSMVKLQNTCACRGSLIRSCHLVVNQERVLVFIVKHSY